MSASVTGLPSQVSGSSSAVTGGSQPARPATVPPPSLKALLFADLHRNTGRADWRGVIRYTLRGETYRFNLVFRCTSVVARRNHLLARILKHLGRLWLRRMRTTMGISVPFDTVIGPGLYLGHVGGIKIGTASPIGRDCDISHNVTIGQIQGGPRQGSPSLGDRVYVGVGAVLMGNIHIGDDAAIGANAVVMCDVPAGATAVGVPARILLNRGSADYVKRTTEEIVPVWP